MKTQRYEQQEFRIPNWALCYFINADLDGLTDEDIEKIKTFEARIVKKYGHCMFSLQDEDKGNLGFCWSNDLDNLGSDCTELILLIEIK